MRPKRVVEIGSDTGGLTEALLEHFKGTDTVVHGIDPRPRFDVRAWQNVYGDGFVFHEARSLDVLARLPVFDLVLIDGDHNWYTVLNELMVLEEIAVRTGTEFPLVICHDAEWPYARRDLYYDPKSIPEPYRHPYAKGGMVPGSVRLVGDGGLNQHLHNAIQEGTARNGVLTALEDFNLRSKLKPRLTVIPGLHGLALLVPKSRGEKAELARTLRSFHSPRFLRGLVTAVERARLDAEIRHERQRILHTREKERAEHAAAQAEDNATQVRVAKEDAESARTRLAAIERQVQDSEQDCSRLTEAVTRLTEQMTAMHEQGSSLAAELDSRRAEAEQRGRDLVRLQAREVEFDQAESERRELTERACALSENLAQARAELEGRERQLAQLEQREARLEKVEGEHRELSAQLAEARAGLVAHVRDVARLSGLEHERRELTERACALSENLAQARAELEGRERQLAQLEQREARLEKVEGEHRELSAQLAEARAGLVAREREISRVGELYAAARADLDTRGREMARVEELYAEVRTELDARGLEIARANGRFEAAQSEHETLAAQLRDAEYEHRRLNRRLDERGSQVDSVQAQLERGRVVATDLAYMLEGVVADLDRLDASKAWRWGHRFTKFLRRLTFRRVVGEGAVTSARARTEAAHATALDLGAGLQPTIDGDDAAPANTPAGRKLPQRREGGPTGLITSGSPPRSARRLGRRWGSQISENGSADGGEPDGDPSTDGERALIRALEVVTGGQLATWERGARPVPTDHLGLLIPEHEQGGGPTVDVVVCVHDAVEDVERCLWSLLAHDGMCFKLILVDDGSGPEAAAFLRRMQRRNPATVLIVNESDRHGYTIAANLGIDESTADYVVLLNSDTIVTPGWLERLVACGESSSRIGVLGPLSNAATHQSLPRVRDGAGWAANELPVWLTPEVVARLVAGASRQEYPRFPFVNGFCYAIKRAAIDCIGRFDENRFARGFCEENDFSYRATEAGFELAVADDAYVFHAKSRSYGADGRAGIAHDHYQAFLQKHGKDRIQPLVAALEEDRSLEYLRTAIGSTFDDEHAFRRAFRDSVGEPLRVLFVLPGLAVGSSGGAHSVYQEVRAMRALGVPARIALAQAAWDRAERAYPDVEELFFPYRDASHLGELAAEIDVAVATHFQSVEVVRRLCERNGELLPAYYVQDYEPLFVASGRDAHDEARASYTAIPGQLLFAKTRWLCEVVSLAAGVPVRKVEPSLDRSIFHPEGRAEPDNGRPLRLAAMVRPRTPRRQAATTLEILAKLQRTAPARVETVSFGCSAQERSRLGVADTESVEHRGVLVRAEVAALLRTVDVFLDCSVYQAFGRTALEGMACGCVPVVPSVGGHREFAHDGANSVVVDTGDAEAVFTALTALAADSDRVERLRAGALTTAAGFSTMRAALSEYLLFDQALRARGAASTGVRRSSETPIV